MSAEFLTEELEDFLRADSSPVQADPVFRERLREELWRRLQGLLRARTSRSLR